MPRVITTGGLSLTRRVGESIAFIRGGNRLSVKVLSIDLEKLSVVLLVSGLAKRELGLGERVELPGCSIQAEEISKAKFDFEFVRLKCRAHRSVKILRGELC